MDTETVQIKHPEMLALFVNTDIRPVKIKHITFFCKENLEHRERLDVYELIDVWYPHPDCIDKINPEILVQTIEQRILRRSVSVGDPIFSEVLIYFHLDKAFTNTLFQK